MNEESKLKEQLQNWMKKTSDPSTKKLEELVGGIQLLKEQYGNITLDEAMDKTSRVILARLIKENNPEIENK